MPDTRLIKPKPVATKPKHINKKTAETRPAVRTRDVSVGHRKNRASSCPRFTHDAEYKPKATERSTKAIKEKQSETLSRSKPATCASKEQPMPKSHSHALYETHSQKAFTVFAPNPKKRQDIQQKAEAELAALEDLRLSRAMGYISIFPSTVGGCLTLEEVRAKQQQEMQIKRRQKQVKNVFLQ
ncbi:epithelial-stromal interaction protein 1 [Pseudorasbora parva]|uniref:epithelial-stromal interaction protein 1 n=1 Tax=Pseudorasbora parva TaxID=51549 RepID=UPI00351E1D0E